MLCGYDWSGLLFGSTDRKGKESKRKVHAIVKRSVLNFWLGSNSDCNGRGGNCVARKGLEPIVIHDLVRTIKGERGKRRNGHRSV